MDTKEGNVKVCVIGAGVCGIVSVKSCLEAGYSVSCFERSSAFGGLWNYRDTKDQPEEQFVPSVMRTTILNTSKELSSFSDYPPPANYPNFMKHSLYMDYIRSYVEHFKLQSHFKFEHEVLSLRPEYEPKHDTIRWLVEVKDRRGGSIERVTFDKVMVAVGHHNIPFCPTFRDQHKFKGLIIHSAKVKDILTDDRLVDKRVVVVGFGNSACDAANDLALVASKCYVSSHRANWFVGRLSPKGLYDFEVKNRCSYYKSKLSTSYLVDRVMMNRISSRINHKFLGLEPKHRPSELVPGINDLFPYRVFTGGVVLKTAIDRYTEDGIIFEGEPDEVYPADVVILATGYEAKLNFLDERDLGLKIEQGNGGLEYDLYMNMFPTHLKLKNQDRASLNAVSSMVFIGLVQPSGSITVVSELQARLACLVFGDKCRLPTIDKQIKHNERAKQGRSRAIRSHSRDQIIGNWMAYCDQVAEVMDVKPDLFKLLLRDFPLWRQLFFGPSVSYQYRLMGPGSWPKAREVIMDVPNRVQCGINDGKNDILYRVRRRRLTDKPDNGRTSQGSEKLTH